MRRTTVFRWDIDKTYLDSHFESLRSLVRVPFEKGRDKVALPGVVELIKGLRHSGRVRGYRTSLFFLSASPPQISGAIREKLELDGIEYEGIGFKNQFRHLVRGDFGGMREQIGYKLSELVASGASVPQDAREFLFGDDWESDPFVYSLYADIVAGHIDFEHARSLLVRVGVDREYLAKIENAMSERLPRYEVGGIFILRQRKRSADELAAFGPRLRWFDNYFECALGLYAAGLLLPAAVVEVARGSGLAPDLLARSFDEVALRRPGPGREALSAPRKLLLEGETMARVDAGGLARRARSALRVAAGLPPAAVRHRRFIPDYHRLLEAWSSRVRRQARDPEEDSDDD